MKETTRENLIKDLLDSKDSSDRSEQLQRIEDKLDFFLEAIVFSQKDSASLIGRHVNTVRNSEKAGKIVGLQGDGQRKKFYTLKSLLGLKRRRNRN